MCSPHASAQPSAPLIPLPLLLSLSPLLRRPTPEHARAWRPTPWLGRPAAWLGCPPGAAWLLWRRPWLGCSPRCSAWLRPLRLPAARSVCAAAGLAAAGTGMAAAALARGTVPCGTARRCSRLWRLSRPAAIPWPGGAAGRCCALCLADGHLRCSAVWPAVPAASGGIWLVPGSARTAGACSAGSSAAVPAVRLLSRPHSCLAVPIGWLPVPPTEQLTAPACGRASIACCVLCAGRWWCCVRLSSCSAGCA